MYGIVKVNGYTVDKGFYSREAIKMLEEVGITFIPTEEQGE